MRIGGLLLFAWVSVVAIMFVGFVLEGTIRVYAVWSILAFCLLYIIILNVVASV